MTIVSGFVAATIATFVTSWDWLTCILVTAPGGSTEMILVALALDHNPEIVTLAHSVRLMALNLSLPLWIFLFRYWEKRTIIYTDTNSRALAREIEHLKYIPNQSKNE